MKVDIQYFLTAKYAKWIIIGLLSLLSILIVGEWGSLFFTSSSYVSSIDDDQKQNQQNKNDASNAILTTSLFGVYVPNDLNSVKKSMLDVTLVGILFASDIDDSQVIIRTASGEEHNFKLGDSIPGDALIKRITSGGVLVERNGTLESLSLPKIDLTFDPAAQPLEEEEK